jgi:hypothetical protein
MAGTCDSSYLGGSYLVSSFETNLGKKLMRPHLNKWLSASAVEHAYHPSYSGLGEEQVV